MANDRIDVGLRLYVDKSSETSVKKKIETLKKQLESVKRNETKLTADELNIQKKILQNENQLLKNKKEEINLAIQKQKLESATLTTKTKEFNLQKKTTSETEKAVIAEKKKTDELNAQILKLDLFKQKQARNVLGLESGGLSESVDQTSLSQFKTDVSNLTADMPNLDSEMKKLDSNFKNIKVSASASNNALKQTKDTTKSLGQEFKDGFEKFSLNITWGFVA